MRAIGQLGQEAGAGLGAALRPELDIPPGAQVQLRAQLAVDRVLDDDIHHARAGVHESGQLRDGVLGRVAHGDDPASGAECRGRREEIAPDRRDDVEPTRPQHRDVLDDDLATHPQVARQRVTRDAGAVRERVGDAGASLRRRRATSWPRRARLGVRRGRRDRLGGHGVMLRHLSCQLSSPKRSHDGTAGHPSGDRRQVPGVWAVSMTPLAMPRIAGRGRPVRHGAARDALSDTSHDRWSRRQGPSRVRSVHRPWTHVSGTMSNDAELIDTLAGFALFADLDLAALERVAHMAEEVVFPAGTRVIRQGLSGSGLHVILEGAAAVVIDGDERARFGPGDFFGEISVLLGIAPVADIVAVQPIRALVLAGPETEAFLLSNPRVMYRMLQAMARRLRAANRWSG